MTIQERINNLRAQEVISKDTSAPLTLRQLASSFIEVHEIAIQSAADAGDSAAQAFLKFGTTLQETLEQFKATHALNCDEDCHSCTACYHRTGESNCHKNCPHTTLEDFDQ